MSQLIRGTRLTPVVRSCAILLMILCAGIVQGATVGETGAMSSATARVELVVAESVRITPLRDIRFTSLAMQRHASSELCVFSSRGTIFELYADDTAARGALFDTSIRFSDLPKRTQTTASANPGSPCTDAQSLARLVVARRAESSAIAGSSTLTLVVAPQ